MPAPVLAPGAGDSPYNQVWFPVAGKTLVASMTSSLPPAGKGQVDSNNIVQFLDPSSWKTLKQFTLAGELASVAGDGKSLAAIDTEHSQVVIYDDQGKELRRVGKISNPYICVLSSDGKQLVTVNQNSEMHTWDTITGKERTMIKGPVSGAEEFLTVVAISSDQKVLFAGTKKGDIFRWDWTTGKELEPLRGHRNWITGSFLPPTDRTLVSVAWDGVVRRWDLISGKEETSPEGFAGHVDVALSPDGRMIATSDTTGRVDTWDAGTGLRLRTLVNSDSISHKLAFSPDGSWLAVPQADRSIHILNPKDGRKVHTLGAPLKIPDRGPWFSGLAFSPDNRFLVTSEDAGTRMWEIAMGKDLWVAPECGQAAFTPDGRTLVNGGFNHRLTFRDVSSGKVRQTLEENEIFDGLAFSPDGSILATSHHNGNIYLRDPITGEKRKTLQGHRDVTWMVSFSPSGKWLASGGDETIRVWEVATGKELLCLKGHEGRAYQAIFGPDSRTVLSSSLDLTALLWTIRPEPASGLPMSLDYLWADLGGGPTKAYAAIWALADDPKSSSAFLRQKISPVKFTVDEKRVQKLLQDLDSNSFHDRESASQALAELGLAAEASMRAALKTTKSTEVRRRITQILDGLKRPPTSDDLRISRAVQALEVAGTAESAAVLAEWADGAPYASLTQDASTALERVRKLHRLR